MPPSSFSASEDLIAQVVAVVKADYDRYLATRPPVALRDQHPRQHVTLRGTLVIAGDVPQRWRHGLFAQGGRTFPVIARWSPNATLPIARDAHGMAVKVMGARYGVDQDLLMANSPVFFARDARACLDLMLAKRAGTVRTLAWYLVRGRRWREAINLLGAVGRRVDDPLAVTYWSGTAIACGPEIVKVAAVPWRHSAAGHGFDLKLQACPPELADDPTRCCREPFTTVGALWFPQQDPADGEDLSFSPGHCLPEHRPLGEVAAVRTAVYEAIADARHAYNLRRA